MAIAFNLPSDDDTDARYEMLNRILLELCELLRNMVAPEECITSAATAAAAAATAAPPIRVRPFSDSMLPGMPDLLLHGCNQLPRRRVRSVQTPPTSPSCSAQHLSRTFSEVFDSTGTDPMHSMAYFGDDEVFCLGTNTTVLPAARSSLPAKQRRRVRRSRSLRDTKRKSITKTKAEDQNWKAVDTACDDQIGNEKDETSPATPIVLDDEKETEGSLISTLLSTKLGGSLWTAVVIVIGWRLLANKR